MNYSQTRYVSFESVVRNRLHRHSFYEPCIVISGSGEFEHGSRVFALSKGDLFIADRGVYHEIRSVESKDLRLYFLSFHIVKHRGAKTGHGQSSLSRRSVADFLLNHRLHLPGQSHLIPLFEHVTQLVRRDAGYRQDKYYHDASLLLIRQVISALATSALMSEEAYSDHLQKSKVEELIENRLHQALRVTDLASECAMSERTLRRKWRAWSSRTLPEEINRRRMQRACQLLLLPDIAVADVGYQVGIASPAQFSRQFKEAKGITPGAYRRRFLDEPPSGRLGDDPALTEYLDGDTLP
ncbi:MAG: AraC family transcriptional regulator [Pseudomonadota bacterium]